MNETMTRWIDNHCHMTLAESDDLLAQARTAGVERCIVIGTDLEQSQEAVSVAERHDGVWATVGVHPHEAEHGTDGIFELLSGSATGAINPNIKAVGECGLDYHYDHSPRQIQRDVFAQHIHWARELNLALVIHSRNAWDDTFDILDREGIPDRTVFHCFTGGLTEAQQAWERGISLSFSGILTFPKTDDLRRAAHWCPPEAMLVETDAPFLTPAPFRGQPNTPANVVLVGEALAKIKGLPAEQVAAISWENASKLYSLN